ncbi:MAG: hypothetical protein B6I26_00700 [Desulfobacteraceae bacterium 4572_130]|nr:MAG: hypothetical protein B6I26_00700 [Desulfobacteraceae bacterium 4572_130]
MKNIVLLIFKKHGIILFMKSFINIFLKIYNLLWIIILPILKTNKELKKGFIQKTTASHLTKADVWIHGSSLGEAYLAIAIIKKLMPKKRKKILITSMTYAGISILKKEIKKNLIHKNIICKISWFPFDMPNVMKNAVLKIKPEIMVLIETEIWPALFYNLKKQGSKIFIVNARLSKKSFKKYLITSFLWKQLSPDKILAVTKKDTKRFKKIFKTSNISTMKNIKFDTIYNDFKSIKKNENQCFNKIINPEIPLSILASIRRQEEKYMEKILKQILEKFPNQIIAIFPKHMNRINFWEKKLTHLGYNVQLKSNITSFAKTGSIILWDKVGELKHVYCVAATTFIGGSLKPLGGQNFIEPIIYGTQTVTGPFIDDFLWVGENIFKKQIVKKARNLNHAADIMLKNLKKPHNKKEHQKKALQYIKNNCGGTYKVCKLILENFEDINKSL